MNESISQGQSISPPLPPNPIRVMAERRAGPLPESEWNRAGVWYRVSETPPTYLPVGYSKARPRTETEGTWVVDERDAKRFFIPNEGTEISRPILHAEAIKVTNWQEKTLRERRR